MSQDIINSVKDQMSKSLDALHKEFVGLRTGRASSRLLDPIQVDAYGSLMPLNQVGTVSVVDARMLSVQVWDKGMVSATEKAIMESNLGLNPSTEGQLIRIPLPQLSAERREELAKVAAKYAEQARVSVRNARREGMDALKKMEKDDGLSEDDSRRLADQIQKQTDEFVKKVDEMLTSKEADIKQV